MLVSDVIILLGGYAMNLNNKELPLCMIGTWAWGTGSNGSRIVFGKKYDEEQLKETFLTAYNAGFKLWDTAEVYGMGNAEKLLGRCINNFSNIFISTKFQPEKKNKSGAAEKALHNSMKRLGVDHVYLYWLHKPYNIRENMKEMAMCVKQGFIHKIGLSNCNISQIKEAQEELSKYGLKLYAVQNHYSLLSMQRQKEVLDYCTANGILFFGYMVLEQGALSGHYDEKHPLPFLSYRGFTFHKRKLRKIQQLIDYERELAIKYSVDAAQIPVAWAIAKNVIPIIGLTKPKHAESLEKGVHVVLQSEEIFCLEQLAIESGVVSKGIWE